MYRLRGSIRLQGGLRSTREWPFKLRRDPTGRRRVSVPVRYRESHLNADSKDPMRFLYVNVSGESFWCFIRPNTAKARTAVPSSPRNTAYLLNHSVFISTATSSHKYHYLFNLLNKELLQVIFHLYVTLISAYAACCMLHCTSYLGYELFVITSMRPAHER